MRAADGQEVEVQAFGVEFFPGGGMVNFNGRKGVVMHAHDLFALEKIGGADGVVHIHRKIAADAQDEEFEFCRFAEEFHVQG